MNWTDLKKKWELKTKKSSEELFLSRFESPLGILVLACTELGVSMIEYNRIERLERNFEDMYKKRSLRFKFVKNEMLKKLELELTEYFSKKRTSFSLPIDSIGTDFQKKVWAVLAKIPFGETWSYSDQAKKYGDEKSIRAVASANGKNKISILLPCHRVIGKNGSLTGYAGGLDKKTWLLEHEGVL